MARAFPSLDQGAEAALVARGRGSPVEREQALVELSRVFRRPVLALCLHVVGDAGEAEDVVQQVFLSVHRALPSFRAESRLSTWIYRIALRAAIASAASARRRPLVSLEEPPHASSTEQELMLRDEARRVAEAMGRLSMEHRSVLSMFAIEGLSHEEIADVLGVPKGTAWSRLSAARRRLLEELRASRRR